MTRRQFGVIVGAGVAMALPAVANAADCGRGGRHRDDARRAGGRYFVHPSSGVAAGVLVWPDIFGLRPAFRQMGKRLAESGYSVLVVNPFYRVKKAPTADNGAATPIADLRPLAAGAQRDDADDRREGVHRLAGSAGVGLEERARSARRATAWAVRSRSAQRRRWPTASARWPRFTAAASSPSAPNSPHLQAATSKAQFLVAIAANDDQRAPTDKDVLKDTFAKAKLQAEMEVYEGAAHGWCPPDSSVYNEPQAEKAWSRLLALYGKALA